MGVLSGLDCPICFDNFPDAQWCVLKICGHIFHVQCMMNWESKTTSNFLTCPYCRANVLGKSRHKDYFVTLIGIKDKELASSPLKSPGPNSKSSKYSLENDETSLLMMQLDEEQEAKLVMEGKLRLKEKEVRDGNKRIRELEENIEEHKAKIEIVEKANLKLTARIEELEANKVDLRRNLKDRKTQVERLKSSIEELERAESESMSQLREQLQDSERVRAELQDMNQRLMEANQSYRLREAGKKTALHKSAATDTVKSSRGGRHQPNDDVDEEVEDVDNSSSHFTDPPEFLAQSSRAKMKTAIFSGFDDLRSTSSFNSSKGTKFKEKDKKRKVGTLDNFLERKDGLTLGPKRRRKI